MKLAVPFFLLCAFAAAQCPNRAYNPFTGTFDCINGPAGPQGPSGPQGPAGPAGSAGPAGGQVLKWSLGTTGTVSVNDTSIQSNQPTQTTTLSSCSAHADTAPTGSAMTIDVLNNGTTVLTAPLSISAGANDSSIVTSFANSSVGPASKLTVKALSVGSTIAGGLVLVKCDTAATGGGGSMVYPGSPGIAVMGASTWGTSLTAPTGAVVGTTDVQTLTNKTIGTAASNLDQTKLGFLSSISNDIQTQLSAKADANASMTITTAAGSLGSTTCSLGGTCTVQVGTGAGGGTTGAGIGFVTDTGGNGTSYAGSPTGCSTSDLSNAGVTLFMLPAHTASGGATTFAYCGGAALPLVLQNGYDLSANDIIVSSTTNPYLYQLVYLGATINKWMLMQNLRYANDNEATQGSAVMAAPRIAQVANMITNLSPLNSLGYKYQIARSNAVAWKPADSPGRPSSGRTYLEFFADGSQPLKGTRMVPATAGANCATPTAVQVSSTAPALVSYATSSGAANQYCGVSSANSVTWAGSQGILDVTLKITQLTNVSYMIALVDSAQTGNSAMLSYASGNYAGAWAGFRFNPNAGDTVTWRCGMAKDNATAPVMDDAGATVGTVSASIIHFQMRLIEATGEVHFLAGPAGGSLTEVCTAGAWGGKTPNNVALSPLIAEFITTTTTAPTLQIADVGIEVNSVPNVSPQ